MAQDKQNLAEQRVQEEALRVANSRQTPGQTKEQTKLIAKGIEKGIALYKQQQKAKARELDKARKKALKLKQRAAAPNTAEPEVDEPEFTQDNAAARPALWAAGAVFALAALLHALRFGLGWAVVIGGFEVPLSWSLIAVPVAAGLSAWMFRASRDA